MGRVDGRPVCVMANDSTVKAGSWGARTVEKILRIQEVAAALRSRSSTWSTPRARASPTRWRCSPGRRGAGRIFHNEVHLSGVVPQICLLFGPSAAGGAYIPAFCDIVVMVEGQRLHVPRLAAHGRDGHRREGDARGDGRRAHALLGLRLRRRPREDRGGGDRARRGATSPTCRRASRTSRRPPPRATRARAASAIEEIVPRDQNKPFDMYALIVEAIVDEGSFLEVKKLFAQELVTGLGAHRRAGRRASSRTSPSTRAGSLFVDSADKGRAFIWLCDAFNMPLLYLADVPGFMIGTKVERAGIIRAGAKMISAVSEATVPRICVVVRKAYGAGLYAMAARASSPTPPSRCRRR